MAAKKPIIALMYDFDKTLCTTDMQAYTFIPNLGMSADAFWKKASDLAENKKMDRILAYMYLMLDEAHIHRQPIRRSDFVALGKDLKLYDGVEGWFGRINQFGKEQGVVIKHYIISSGLREIIEGSSIFKEFDDVFAGEFPEPVQTGGRPARSFPQHDLHRRRINRRAMHEAGKGERRLLYRGVSGRQAQ